MRIKKKQSKAIYGVIRDRLYVQRPSFKLRDGVIEATKFPNPKYEDAKRFSPWGPPKHLSEFIEVAEYDPDTRELICPRGLDVSQLTEPVSKLWNRIQWRDERHFQPAKFPTPLLPLNAEQKGFLRDFRKAARLKMRPFGNFLYVAPTSVGKTIMNIALAAETGQRTLILCQTNLIKKAWYDDLEKFLGLAKSDIGLIQQNHWSIGDQFTIASIATLGRRRARWDEISQTFGTIILDEAHTVTEPRIHQFIESNASAFHLGATATPSKGSFRLHNNFGFVKRRLFSQQRNTQNSLALTFVDLVDTDFQYEYDPQNLNWHDLADQLSCDELRNELIVSRAFQDHKEGHSVLVVTKRVPHVHLLAGMLREAGLKSVNVLTGETNANADYTSKLVNAVLNRDTRCLVATDRAIKLGANLNPVSRLHLGMPVAHPDDLEQLIGRIRRRADKKTDCGLVYYLDIQVPYLFRSIYVRRMTHLFRKLKVKGYRNTYIV